jgi:hypothetical protein
LWYPVHCNDATSRRYVSVLWSHPSQIARQYSTIASFAALGTLAAVAPYPATIVTSTLFGL